MGKRGRPKGSKNKTRTREVQVQRTKKERKRKSIVTTQTTETQIQQPQIQIRRKKELWFKFVSKQDTFIDSETHVTCGVIYPLNGNTLFQDIVETYKLNDHETEIVKELFTYLSSIKSTVYSYSEYISFVQEIDNLINKINSSSLLFRITKTLDEDLDMGTTKIVNYKYIIKTKSIDIDGNENNNKKKKVSNNTNTEGKKRGRPRKNNNNNEEVLVL